MSSVNGVCVVPMLDKNGATVGYATGTSQETTIMTANVWPSATGTVTQTAVSALQGALIARVQEYRQAAADVGVRAFINKDNFMSELVPLLNQLYFDKQNNPPHKALS